MLQKNDNQRPQKIIFKSYYRQILYIKKHLLFNETSKEKRFVIACNYINRKIPDMLVDLKNDFS